MSLPIAATIEQTETTRAWTRTFYDGIQSGDLSNWVTQNFQADAVLNVGNLPPFKGHDAILKDFEKQRTLISSFKYEILHVDVFADRIYVQKEESFIVKNDSEQKEIELKTVTVIWKKVDEKQVSAMDIYLDPTPLLEKIKACS